MNVLQSLLLIYGHICHHSYFMNLPVSKENPVVLWLNLLSLLLYTYDTFHSFWNNFTNVLAW